ncbi:hypothetical protein EVAR_23208_1 [Eumeta japonica]|uniref:Uncharacterized protein n=1 Tax=Eumeta variegata TaxID=151549 RepID=A0A4C1VDL6_EUMVA|nr:hypothetical protein EVAR_23208_1 [Eumeta japonica]
MQLDASHRYPGESLPRTVAIVAVGIPLPEHLPHHVTNGEKRHLLPFSPARRFPAVRKASSKRRNTGGGAIRSARALPGVSVGMSKRRLQSFSAIFQYLQIEKQRNGKVQRCPGERRRGTERADGRVAGSRLST